MQAALKRHLDEVTDAVALVCKEQKGATLRQMATALITVFFEAKMRKAKTSGALYSVSSDLDGAKIVQQIGVRTNKMTVEMLKSSSEPLTKDPELVGSILQGAMAGIIRRLLESVAPEREFESLQQELILFACAYLEACSPHHQSRPPSSSALASY